MKTFYQCDVAEGNDADGSIWTSSVHYCETAEEAEFLTMLELQRDWGDGYMPDAFIDAFGGETSLIELQTGQSQPEPEFPGVEAWKQAGYFDDIPAKTGMLTVDPAAALAKLGKIEAPSAETVEAAMSGDVKLRLAPAESPPADNAAIGFALRNASGAISSLLHQVGQMRGMFGDGDGTIQDAVDAGEAAEIEIENALEALGLALGVGAKPLSPLTVAVSVSGGVLQWAGSNAKGVRVIVIDYDQDGAPPHETVDMAEPDSPREEMAAVYEESVEVNPEAIARIEEKRAERALRETRFEAGDCIECGNDLDSPSACPAEDGICGECIGGGEE